MHVLAISGQHVAVLAAVIYFALRAFAFAATGSHLCDAGPGLAVHSHRGRASFGDPGRSRRYVRARGLALGRLGLTPALYELTTH